MSSSPSTHEPSTGFGMLSLVLGVIGLLLAFLPILGGPISGCGLLFGLIGIILTFVRGGVDLRWSLLGSVVCITALMINLALTSAPRGYLQAPAVPTPWQPVPDRFNTPPPARTS